MSYDSSYSYEAYEADLERRRRMARKEQIEDERSDWEVERRYAENRME